MDATTLGAIGGSFATIVVALLAYLGTKRTAKATTDAKTPELIQSMMDAANKLISMQERATAAIEDDLHAARDEVARLTVEHARLVSEYGKVIHEMQGMRRELEEVHGELRAARETAQELTALLREHGVTIPDSNPPVLLISPGSDEI